MSPAWMSVIFWADAPFLKNDFFERGNFISNDRRKQFNIFQQ